MWEHILCRKHAFNGNSFHESQNVPLIEKNSASTSGRRDRNLLLNLSMYAWGDHHNEQS